MFQLAVYSDHTGFVPAKASRKTQKKPAPKSPKSQPNRNSVQRGQKYTIQRQPRRDLFDDDGEECFFCSIEEFCASFWMVFAALVIFIVTFTMMYSESEVDTDFGTPVLTTRSTHRHYSMEEDVRFHQKVSCDSRENFIFLRHNRTGNTKLTNILQQFGYKKNLGFAIPDIEGNDSCTRHFNMTAVHMKRRKSNILCNSARYNKTTFLKLLPANSIYLTMLKNPVMIKERMTSITSDIPSVDNLGNLCNGQEYTGYEMMYNFGFNSSELNSNEQIRNAIMWIEKTFDLVMIEEYFDESLLLLKKLMCWSLDDITYYLKKQNDSSQNQTLSVTGKDILNSPDYHLYKHFNDTLWKRIATYGQSFEKDLEELQFAKRALRNTCQPRIQFYMEKKEIHPLLLSKSRLLQKPSLQDCLNYIRNNTDFTRMLIEEGRT